MTAIVTVCVPVYGQDLVLQLTLLSDCFLALENSKESFLPLGDLWRLLSEGRVAVGVGDEAVPGPVGDWMP